MESHIYCGSVNDSFETLMRLCEKKSEELCKTISIPTESTIVVTFWTNVFAELICIGEFSKDKDGNIRYELDYSQSTI